MAYSNWGAFVHKDNVRRTDREDVAVFNDDEKDAPSGARIFLNIIKNREKYPDGNPPWHAGSQHAVLGDGPIRLVGYKNYASLYELTAEGDVIDVDLAPFQVGEDAGGYGQPTHEGEYKGAKFTARPFNGNMIDLSLVEADGAVWEARCGMSYGAGHMAYTAADR
jgi:hypothetical protein